MAADGSVVIQIVGDDKEFKASLGGLGNTAKSALAGVATAVTAASAAIGGLAAAAAKVGSEFETSLAGTSTMFGDVAVDMDGLTDRILSLSSTTGLAAKDLSSSLYNALSAGIPVTEDMAGAMGYMESSAKLAAAGFTDVDTAVTATAKVMNAYGMSLDDVDGIHKVMLQTQNKGITTVNELGATLAQVTPTAAAMGVSFENVGAALATMTAQGTPTAQATTQLNALIAELGKNGTTAAKNLEKASKGTEHAGKGFSQLMEEGVPLNEVLDLMGDYATANGLSMIDMFSSIEAGKSALAMAGENSEAFASNLAAMATEADVVGDAYTKVTDTLQHQTDVLKANVENLGISLYQSMDTPLKELAGRASSAVAEISSALQQGGIAAAVGSLGGILADALIGAAEMAPSMIDMGVGLIQSLLSGIQESLPNLVAGAAGIVSSLASGVIELVPQLWETAVMLVQELAGYIIDNVPQMFPAAIEMLAGFVETVTSDLSSIIDTGIQVVMSLVDGLIEALPALIAYVPEIVSNIANVINENAPKLLAAGLELIVKLVAGLVENIPVIIANLPKIIMAIVDTILAFNWISLGGSVIKALSGGLSGAVGFIKTAASGLKDTLVNSIKELPAAMKSIGGDIVRGLLNGIKGAWGWLKDQASNLVGGLVGSVKNALGIHSPSRVFAEIGDYMAQGLGNGFAGQMKDVSRDIEDALPAPALPAAKAMGAAIPVQALAAASDFQRRAADAVRYENASVGAKAAAAATANDAPGRGGDEDLAILFELRSLRAEVQKGHIIELDGRPVGRTASREQANATRMTGKE